jgi:hypothetical protein
MEERPLPEVDPSLLDPNYLESLPDEVLCYLVSRITEVDTITNLLTLSRRIRLITLDCVTRIQTWRLGRFGHFNASFIMMFPHLKYVGTKSYHKAILVDRLQPLLEIAKRPLMHAEFLMNPSLMNPLVITTFIKTYCSGEFIDADGNLRQLQRNMLKALFGFHWTLPGEEPSAMKHIVIIRGVVTVSTNIEDRLLHQLFSELNDHSSFKALALMVNSENISILNLALPYILSSPVFTTLKILGEYHTILHSNLVRELKKALEELISNGKLRKILIGGKYVVAGFNPSKSRSFGSILYDALKGQSSDILEIIHIPLLRYQIADILPQYKKLGVLGYWLEYPYIPDDVDYLLTLVNTTRIVRIHVYTRNVSQKPLTHPKIKYHPVKRS